MRKLFKERKLIKGGNYMRKYGIYIIRDLRIKKWKLKKKLTLKLVKMSFL